MDKRTREIIQEYKSILSGTISLERIKVLVKEYKIFTKAMFDDIFDPEGEKRDFYDELCTRGPDAFLKFIFVLINTGYKEAAADLKKKVDNTQFPIYYKMEAKEDPDSYIGYCLIIVNQKFDSSKLYREGCQVDAGALKNLFEKLKYHVEIEWNKQKEEMESILEKFSKKAEFENVDSCIVYILSHGGQSENLEYILGNDCERVYKKNIFSMFNNKNCPLLLDKPKIFFFQACRGKLLDYGVSKNSSCDANENACKVDNNTKKRISTDSVDDTSCHKFDKELKYPLYSDMFIVHSSLPDHKSWKDHVLGSWLCQDLVYVVDKYYDKYDFATMMTFVNCLQKERKSEEGCKQIAHLEQIGVAALLQFKRNIT